ALHARWDVRFSEITYLPRLSLDEPQRFEYRRQVFPGLAVRGTGEVFTNRSVDGTATSALRFTSTHPLSPIVRGSGVWRYVPGPDGIRFIPEYDYEPRWGRAGRLLDRVIVRPAMTWLTAVGFDRLRRWLETGVAP